MAVLVGQGAIQSAAAKFQFQLSLDRDLAQWSDEFFKSHPFNDKSRFEFSKLTTGLMQTGPKRLIKYVKRAQANRITLPEMFKRAFIAGVYSVVTTDSGIYVEKLKRNRMDRAIYKWLKEHPFKAGRDIHLDMIITRFHECGKPHLIKHFRDSKKLLKLKPSGMWMKIISLSGTSMRLKMQNYSFVLIRDSQNAAINSTIAKAEIKPVPVVTVDKSVVVNMNAEESTNAEIVCSQNSLQREIYNWIRNYPFQPSNSRVHFNDMIQQFSSNAPQHLVKYIGEMKAKMDVPVILAMTSIITMNGDKSMRIEPASDGLVLVRDDFSEPSEAHDQSQPDQIVDNEDAKSQDGFIMISQDDNDHSGHDTPCDQSTDTFMAELLYQSIFSEAPPSTADLKSFMDECHSIRHHGAGAALDHFLCGVPLL